MDQTLGGVHNLGLTEKLTQLVTGISMYLDFKYFKSMLSLIGKSTKGVN